MIANVGLGQWNDNPISVPEEFQDEDVQVTLEVDQIFSPLRHTKRTITGNWA
ncbi:MAG: hypothetical protein WDM89_10930 [Rhizomicrobium sp.]